MNVSLRNVLLKALVLFSLANFGFALGDPLPALGRLSAYNALFPGRPRFPFGEVPEQAYNFSLFQLDAMFASHEVAAPEPAGEYRVFVLGDSSVWGTLLRPEDTLVGRLNAAGLALADGRPMRFYNLGYPTISLTKDLLLLSMAIDYRPDLIVWLVTLEAFPYDNQLDSPLVAHNAAPVRRLIEQYDLRLQPADPALADASFWERTLIGRRRALADVFRLQLYGVMWAATGVDQYYPPTYEPRAEDLSAEAEYHALQPPHLAEQALAFDVLSAGVRAAGGLPLLLVNEPMFVSSGENSDRRYNFFYPRWAYDDYRELLGAYAHARGWRYLDAWDAVANAEFTNSAIHYTPVGSAQLAARVAPEVLALAEMSGDLRATAPLR